MTESATLVHDWLRIHCVGRQRAARVKDVAALLGMTWRSVEHAVEELRNGGVFIASARTGAIRGIYIPASEIEWQAALGSFRSATITQIRTYQAMRRARWKITEAITGQQTLFQA